MAGYSESVSKLVAQLSRLPGIGKKSAERLAYHLLRVSKSEALGLAEAIREVRENVQYCKFCYHLTEGEVCEICRDPQRDPTVLCIVEQTRDLLALEQAGVFKGLYHVLLGRISPLEGIGPDQLTLDPLMERVRTGKIQEIVLATNPTVEGDGTLLYISHLLQNADFHGKVTRLARGITTGSVLEYANKEILADALRGRQSF